MKIDRNQPIQPGRVYGSVEARTGKAQSAPQTPTGPTDSVDLSRSAQDVTALRTQLREMPEVRTELVERIKEQLRTGKYQVSAHDLADRLLEAKVLER